MNKKIVVIVAIIAAVVVGGFCTWEFLIKGMLSSGDSNEQSVYVESVKKVTGLGSLGINSRYSGVVEPQKEVKVTKDADKKISKILVAEGQTVKAGDVLFTYDIEDISLNLEQAKLELEGIGNSISLLYSNIEDMEKQKSGATNQQQIELSLQIQSAQLDIKNKEYEKAAKQTAIEKLEKSLNNAEVKSEIDGIVKSINTNESEQTSKPLISILSTGNYRIKGTASELNVSSLSVGQNLIIRSRIDDTTWTGTIESIDVQSSADDNQSGGMAYYNGMDSGSSKATKYNFYVKLNSADGLMLGQHIYCELDFGQQEVKEGLWLPIYYIADIDTEPYVWASENEKLVKRSLEIGERDEEAYTAQILSGLEDTDYIAIPQDYYKEGLSTTTEMVVENMVGTEGFSENGDATMGEAYTEGDSVMGGADTEGNMTGEIVGGDNNGTVVGEEDVQENTDEVVKAE